MLKKPLYSFNHIDDVGVNRVPLDNLILLEDDGAGGSRLIFLKDNTGINAFTTMSDLINVLTGNWYDVGGTGGGGTGSAATTSYDNTTSALAATNLQDATDELDASMDKAVEDQLINITNLEAAADIDTILGT